MSCWTSHKVSLVLIVTALALLWITAGSNSIVCGVLSIAIVVLDIVQTLIFYRCPHCGRLLPLRQQPLRLGPPIYCPHCGRELLPPDQQDRHPDW